jgi:hypothetical protein
VLSIGARCFWRRLPRVEKNVQERCPAGVSIWSNHPTLLRLGSIVCQILLDRENTIGDLDPVTGRLREGYRWARLPGSELPPGPVR